MKRLFIALLLTLAMVSQALAVTVASYQDFITGTDGRPLSGATITVKDQAGDPITLYDPTGTSDTGNPTYSNSQGYFIFWAVPGTYDVTVAKSGQTTFTLENVEVGLLSGGLTTGDFADSLTLRVATKAAAQALSSLAAGQIILIGSGASLGDGYEGMFVYRSGDFSTEVSADTQHGVYLPLSEDSDGSDGCLVRRFDYLTPEMFGAVKDGDSGDDATNATAFSALADFGWPHLKFAGTYYVEGDTTDADNAMMKFSGLDGIRIEMDDVNLINTSSYVADDKIHAIFEFEDCNGVEIDYFIYNGQDPWVTDIDNASTGIGYVGESIIYWHTGSQGLKVSGDWTNARYGVLSGNYSDPSLGGCKGAKVDVQTYFVGYPIAFYLVDDVDVVVNAEDPHRSIYLAGCRGGSAIAYFKNQHIAPVQVLVSDAYLSAGVSRGSSGLECKGFDLGSTTFKANSWCCGLSMSRVDPGTKFSNIDFEFYVKASDTVATTLGGFSIVSGAKVYEPSYPFNWEQTISLENIKAHGVIDRSDQTAAEHGVGEVYVNTFDTSTHYATVRGIDFSDVIYLPGSGSKPRGFWFIMPGLDGTAKVSNSDFGPATDVQWNTNTTSLSIWSGVRAQASNVTSADTSRIHMIGCDIADALLQPLANVTTVGTTIGGAVFRPGTKVAELSLSGADTTWSSSLPNNAIILGVSGEVTEQITGATGYLVGIPTDTDQFANTNSLTVGSSFSVGNTAADIISPAYQKGTGSIVVTAKTSDFTAGKIILIVHYIVLGATSS